MELEEIRKFEADLDAQLHALPTLSSSGAEGLALSLQVLEAAYSMHGSARFLRDGLSVLVGPYLSSQGVGEPEIEEIANDLFFGAHYYMLREYLYYRYNRPNAVDWTRQGQDISITIADRSLVRQFFHTANRWFLESTKRFGTYTGSTRITQLLKEAKGEVHGEVSGELAELILYEVDLKLSAYYTILSPVAEVSFGNYSYADFYQVYRQILGIALIHRYISRLEENPTVVVTFSREDLVSRLSSSTTRSAEICRAILNDMVFDAAAVTEKLNAVYFSLFATSADEILMSPTDLLLHEGLVSILRVVAQRRPQHFLTHLSNPLGHALTVRVCETFKTGGLTASHNVSLLHLDPSLPDIDVLAISEERTLGYVIYVVETKNPLPPQWAKDQLRSVQADSIPKAVSQLDRILDFLKTPVGVAFLRERLPTQGLPHFGDEFLVLLKGVIVTSNSVGMLMDPSPYPIIDYRTLESILTNADGDVVYINWAIGQLDAIADQGTAIESAKVRIGDWNVAYDAVTIKALIDLGPNSYKAAGIDKKLAEDFVAAGHHPYDVLVTLRSQDRERPAKE